MTERQEALLEWMGAHPAREYVTAHDIVERAGLYPRSMAQRDRAVRQCLADLRDLKRAGLVNRSAGYPAFWHLTVRTPA